MQENLAKEKSDIGTNRYVIAINFRTTNTLYAFSFTHSPDQISFSRHWGSYLGCDPYTTPSCVLIGPDGDFDSFGYDAERKYGEIVEYRGDKNKWDLYRNFGMIFHRKVK